MATEIEFDIDIESDATVAREPRIPNAVWINRPSHPERGNARPVSAIVGAITVAALLGLGVTLTRDRALVSPAVADTPAESTGNGPTGYFPDKFERVTGEIEPLPPTF